MKPEKNIRMLMESTKWNLSTLKRFHFDISDVEQSMVSTIKTLAWVLGDEDIALEVPDHYDKEGCHSMQTQMTVISPAGLKEYNKLQTELASSNNERKECPGWDVDASEDGQSIIPCEHGECKTTNKKWGVHEIEDQEDLWY